MRLIDADVAIEELTDRSHQAAKRVGTDSPFWEGLVIARRIVNNLPTIQPEPTDEQVEEYCKRRCLHIVTDDFFHTVQPERAKGEWINTNPEYKNGFYNNCYYCSECHDYYTTSPYEMKFCPNCGAEMIRQNG